MKGSRRFKGWLFNPLWLIVGIAAILVACGGDATATPRPVATAAPAAAKAAPTTAPAAAAPKATPNIRAPGAKPLEPTKVPKATVAPTATTPPQTAKITRVSMANPPPLTENNRIWSGAWSILLQHDPYGETLIENHEVSSEPVPSLAKNWEISNGFKTWTFELQEGVPWHFGFGEFTSADVEHTWGLYTREDSLSNFKAVWESGTPTIIDDYNIEFNFDPPMVDGTRLFSRQAGDLVIHSKAQWDAAGGDPSAYDDKPAGTGSYQYGGRELGQSMWYEKAPGDHWAGENPDFQELEWVWAVEQFTRLSLLLAGEVQGSDLARDVRQQAFDRGMIVVGSNNENNQSFGFFGGSFLDTDNEYFQGDLPWHNALVREAMNRAVDRDAMKEAIYMGQATSVLVPTFAPFNEGWSDRWSTDFEADYGYDPEKAIALLKEAGYGPGDISIGLQAVVIPGNAEIPLLIETLATMWEAIGINTSIQDLELGTWLGTWQGHDTHNLFSITRNTPLRTTQEGVRTFFASDPEGGFFHGFEHDYINENFVCLRDSVDAQVRDDCARKIGDFIYDEYASLPMFQQTFDMVIDPEYISDWQYPGVGSAHPTHVHNIRACPVGTERCE